MPKAQRKKRVPTLKFTRLRKIGWHVSYRDPTTGIPKKHSFGMIGRDVAERAYHEWVAKHLNGQTPTKKSTRPRKLDRLDPVEKLAENHVSAEILPGSLLHVTSSLLKYEQSRTRKEGEPRRQGSIGPEVYHYRSVFAQEILRFLNKRHGQGAVGRLMLVDLQMSDVEAYNRVIVDAGYSASQVRKRMQFLKAIIDRAGRPEHHSQVLTWNWNSRDVFHGKPGRKRTLPSLPHLKAVLKACSERETAIVWLAIGCGFGQRDLSAICVGQIDRKSYDLRRGKTGIDRYGETPPLVWRTLRDYLATQNRKQSDLLFVTRNGYPLVHGATDTVAKWWRTLCNATLPKGETFGGFYTLRHLGATEFGSRPGCSIGAMKRWLGHSASSQMADVYMKPVSPEDRAVVEWVRRVLKSGTVKLGGHGKQHTH